jgi:Nod factor-specific ABC transporter NodJ protein
MRWIAVWRRNFLVWRKLLAASVLTNLADPLIMLFGLGYGLGALMPAVEGMSYISFFAAGQLCTATMYTASFESMFSGFSRMHGQKTWDAILYAPLVIDDVVAGEIMWAASKAWLTGSTILGVVLVFGLAASPLVLLALPAAFLALLAEVLPEALRVGLLDRGGVRLGLHAELAQATDDLLVGEAGLLGQFVDADLAHGWNSPMTARGSRGGPLPRSRPRPRPPPTR